jgi:hypothetical protein
MLLKHVVVVAFIAMAVAIDRLIQQVRASGSGPVRAGAWRRLALLTEGLTALGALIALMTAAAQAAG